MLLTHKDRFFSQLTLHLTIKSTELKREKKKKEKPDLKKKIKIKNKNTSRKRVKDSEADEVRLLWFKTPLSPH